MPRKAFDGIRVSQDIAQMQAADKVSPPSAKPSLMDVVRQLAGYIDTRARLGWTETMIAAVLTEAGYAIAPGTLRSYCTRLRNEGLLPPLTGKTPKQPIPTAGSAPAAQPPVPGTAQPIPTITPTGAKADVVDATMSIKEPNVDSAMSRGPPVIAPAPPKASPRRFSIDPTKRPVDRA